MFKQSILVLFCILILGPAFSAGAFDAGPQPELKGWWPLDDGAGSTAVDASGNGHDGAIQGTPQWVVGMIDGALEFNGTDNYIDCGDGDNFQFLNDITIACWIKVNAFTTSWQAICTSGDGSWRVHRNSGTNTIAWGTSGLGLVDLPGTTDVSTGDWFHIACTYDGANKILYINGVQEGISAETGTIGTSTYNVNIGENNQATGRYFNGIIDDVRIYNRGLTAEEVRIVMAGWGGNIATDPVPEDGAVDIPRDTVLSWSPSKLADTHDVYFGTVFDDVNNADRANPMGVLVSQGQAASEYDPDGLLEFGTTYYWRIDEVNAPPDSTIFKGETWSFTSEPFAYAVENIVVTSNGTSEADAGPENAINGSGLNADDQHSVNSTDMWLASAPEGETLFIQFEFDSVYKMYEMLVWNYNSQFEAMLGFGLKDVTVEYSADGAEWTVLGDVELAQATALSDYTANTTIAFDGAAVKYVKLVVNSAYGTLGSYGLSEVRFMYIPATAREPQPADGATDVSVTTALAWRAGRDSVSHEVSLGTAADALASIGTPADTSVDPGALDLDMTYYWKADETTDTGETWAGKVWSFATQEYLVVDDFESYDNEDNAVYSAWVDGWVNGTGSTVGHLVEPFAETTIVNSGSQSMPLFYDNAGVDTAEAELDLNQDWTAHGITSLSLYFYGDTANTGGQLYIKINDTRIDYDGDAANITRPSWQSWNIDLATAGNVSNVQSLTIGIEGAGEAGVLYVDDIRLYPEVRADVLPDITAAGDTVQGVPNDGDWPAAEYPDLAIDDDTSTKYLHRKGGSMATGFQVEPMVGATIVTGLTFTTANDDYGRDPTSFELYGSNDSIDGPYELIAAGEIVDFSQADLWPRFTKTETPIEFENTVAYTYYQVLFPTVDRSNNDGLMQIAEVELLGEVVP